MRKRWIVLGLLALAGLVACGCSDTSDPAYLYKRGMASYHQGDYTQAIAMFKWALERYRSYSDAMIGLAKCHWMLALESSARHDTRGALKDLSDAIYWVDQAITVDPGNRETYATKINIVRTKADVESAVAASSEPGVAGPTAATSVMLAQTYAQMDDDANAERAFRQAATDHPESVQVLAEVARFYDQTGRSAEALKYYRQAYRIDPYFPGLAERINLLEEKLKAPKSTTTAPAIKWLEQPIGR